MILFYAEKFFFLFRRAKKVFFFSRAEHFFSSSTSSFRFVHEHTDGALYTTTIIWSSSSSFFFLSTSSSSPHSTALCALAHIHTHTRARAHTHSVTHACILHSYEPSRAFIRSSCMCACVSVCTTCLRGTSVQCSIRNHMFFSFIAVRRKMPPDGILNVKCAIRHWAYTRTSVHVCLCECEFSYMHACVYCSINAWRIWWHFLNRWFCDFQFFRNGSGKCLSFSRIAIMKNAFLWHCRALPTQIHVYFVKFGQLWFYPAA